MPSVQLPQGRIHYREAGTGEPVVFLHGYLMAGDLWGPVVDRLSDDLRCITPDLPMGAHPEAMNPDADLTAKGLAALVADFLAALDLDGVTLVGNDSGGGIAQLVAAHHPERIGRLVLTSCDAFENFPPSFFKALIPAARVPGALTELFLPLKTHAGQKLPIAYGWLMKRPLPHDLIDGWVARFYADRGVRRDCVKVTRGLGTDDLVDAAAKLTAFDKPALVAFATEDKLFPYEHAERLAAIMPDARLAPIGDSRTWVMQDQPAATAEAIRGFVRETSPAAVMEPSAIQ